MDAELAASVHDKIFDFDEVSKALKDTLNETELNGIDRTMITAESCRLRRCELDVEEDGGGGDGDIAKRQKRTIPKIAVGQGGKQLSFEQLQRHVNSNHSLLLVPPTMFPGVGGGGDNDDDDDDEDGVIEIMTREQIFNRFVKRGGVTDFETLD